MNRRDFLQLTALSAAAAAAPTLLTGCRTSRPAIAAQNRFVHPGLLHTNEELAFVKEKIVAGAEPWKSDWERLQSSNSGSRDYRPEPRAVVERGPYNNPDIGSSEMSRDASAAYSQALRWCLTGEEAHAKISVAILNAWSGTLQKVIGHDTKLLIGMMGVRFCNAAELMRHSYTGWKAADQQRFERLLREIFYPAIADFFPKANGNWDASMIQTMLAMGIFLDDRAMFDRATDYYLHGAGNGAVRNYFYPTGQCQESGRDQGHTQMGIGFLGCACELAWKQGVDLYGAYDNRLAKGFEYTAKYNLGHDVPYEPYRSYGGTYYYEKISTEDRGRLSAIYDLAVYHYDRRMGLEMTYSREALAQLRTRNRSRGSQGLWGALMFSGLPPRTSHPLPGQKRTAPGA